MLELGEKFAMLFKNNCTHNCCFKYSTLIPLTWAGSYWPNVIISAVRLLSIYYPKYILVYFLGDKKVTFISSLRRDSQDDGAMHRSSFTVLMVLRYSHTRLSSYSAFLGFRIRPSVVLRLVLVSLFSLHRITPLLRLSIEGCKHSNVKSHFYVLGPNLFYLFLVWLGVNTSVRTVPFDTNLV